LHKIDFGTSFKPFDNGYRQIQDPVTAKPWDIGYVQERARKLEDIGPIVVTLVKPDYSRKDLEITVLNKLPDGSYELVNKRGEDAVGYFEIEPTVQFPDPEKRYHALEVNLSIGNITLNADNLNSVAGKEESDVQALFAGWGKPEDKHTYKKSIDLGIKLEDLGDIELSFGSTFRGEETFPQYR